MVGARAGDALTPLFGAEWRCEGLSLKDAQTLSVRFASEDGGRLDVTVLAGPVVGPVLKRLSHVAVRYGERLVDRSPRARAQAAELVSGIAEAVNARLASTGAATLAEALGRDPTPRRVTFSRQTLRALLGTVIPDGAELPHGFRLHDVYPTSHMREAVGSSLELVLDFRRDSDAESMHIVVGQRDDARPCFAKTPHFSVRYLTLGGTEPADGLVVRLLVALALEIADHEHLDVLFPKVDADLAMSALESGDGRAAPLMDDAALNLAIDAACGQSCAFCSVQERSPPHDGGAEALERYRVDLRVARERGVKKLRLNGYDPLAYSRVFDVLREARTLGYEHVDVFSPFTRVADDDFARELLDVLPPSAFFHVPLYATHAALHDQIVGRKGAFDLVMRAIERLEAARGKSAIHVITVVVRDNVPELPALHAWARARGLHYAAHLPHPTYEGETDRFYRSAARQTEVARALVDVYPDDGLGPAPVGGVAPCVLLRVLGDHGIGPEAWLHGKTQLPGTEYADDGYLHGAGHRAHSAYVAATIACPDAARCAMAETCGGRLLRAYVDLHGIDEFRAVSVREIVERTAAARTLSRR